VVGESSLQVGSWSWWAPVLSDGCATPSVRLLGLVSICGHRHWSPVALAGGRGASSCSLAAVFGGLVLAEQLLLFAPWCHVGRVVLPLRISCRVPY
jgi:hypothetical protein